MERSIAKAQWDPFYASVVKRFGVDALHEAGFFDDGSSVGHDMTEEVDDRFLTTPLGKIRNAMQRHGATASCRSAVLVTSGAFCPIHTGHLHMMESAKRAAERRGWSVVGGFFAPDHDGYVSVKCGDEALSAADRVYLAQVATEESTWLAVDPWAALYLDRAVNYTDIVRRLTRYLRFHLSQEIEVLFVCGGDNHGFSKAFLDQGHLIVVPRVGTSLPDELYAEASVSERILIAGDHLPNQIASRSVRRGQWDDLPPRVLREFRRCVERKTVGSVRILVRDEEAWSVAPWKEQVGEMLESARRSFVASLTEVLADSFRSGCPNASVAVSRISLGDQREVVRQMIDTFAIPTISLDACIEGHYSIALSRRFEVTSGERCEGIFPRPGEAELMTQFQAIPSGAYVLMDDDIATGKTIRALRDMLPSRIEIQGVLSAQEVYTKESLRTVECSEESDLVDVVDLRDFLVGSREGGLVVRLPDGCVARAPYLLPYVQNNRRMSLPLSEELRFSRSVWELNRRFFDSLPVALTVADCPEPFRNLAAAIGFTPETLMSELCQWHLEQLLVDVENRGKRGIHRHFAT